MKKTFLIIAALTAATMTSAQTVNGTITVRARQDLTKVLPKDIVYLLPDFTDGVVDFTDGTSSSGRINICNIDNSVRFIHSTGDTLLLSNGERVSRVIADGTVYMKAEDGFLRQAAAYGSTSLCERKRLTIDEAESNAGYSGLPPTSMAKSAKMVEVDHDRMDTGERELKYRFRTDVVLTDGKKVYISRLSSFNKIFPSSKKAAKAFVRTNKTNFQNLQSAASLFMFCAEQQ